MKINIGVVGPRHSVDRIIALANHFEEIRVYPFSYRKHSELDHMIPKATHIHQWLFSGPVPYHYCLDKQFVTEENASFPKLYTPGLLVQLVKVLVETTSRHFSIDTIDVSEIEDLQEDETLATLNLMSHHYDKYYTADTIVNKHLELVHEHGAVVLTCIDEVYEALRKRGTQVYRVQPSRMMLEQSLDLLRAKGAETIYNEAIVAIVSLVLESAKVMSEEYSYERKRKEMIVEPTILKFAEEIQGSYVREGNGWYTIYTTKGQLEAFLHEGRLPKLIETIQELSGLHARLSIGYGLTNLQAEHQSEIARTVSREEKIDWVIVDETKEITFLNKEQLLSTSVQTTQHVPPGLSPMNLSKLMNYCHHSATNELTAHDLQNVLQSSLRFARKTLQQWEESGFAKRVGEQQIASRGRPRIVYKLNFV